MTRRLSAWTLAALPAAGCLSIPPYDPMVKVTITQDGSGTSVGGTGFSLHFPVGNLFHFPDQLTFDGAKVLGNDTSMPCFDRNLAGIQLAPSSRISGDVTAMIMDPMVKNEIQPVLPGPAVVQMRVDWANPLCGAMRMPRGTSTFTVFLDGRIVRHDRLDDSSTMDVNAVFCQCTDMGAPSEFSVSSYWTFDRNALSTSPNSAVETADRFAQEPQLTQSPLPPDVNGQVFACFDDEAYQVASAQRIPSDEMDPRQFPLHSTATLLALTHYQVTNSSVLGDFPWDHHSAVFLEHRGCAAAFDRAKEYLADPPSTLLINDTPVMLSENDGIYGGDLGKGTPGVVLATDRAELKGPVTSPFAVWLHFPHAVELLRAKLPGATGAWYIPQQVDSHTWIVWFHDPLGDTQTIVIEPD